MNDKTSVQCFNNAIKPLSPNLRQILKKIPDDLKSDIQEIRLRSNKPLSIIKLNKIFFVARNGNLTSNITNDSIISSHNDVTNSFHTICNYSVYSHQNEIRNGFVTFSGGHRVGVCGTAVINDGKMSGVRDIISLNIRIAKEIKGTADHLLSQLNWNLNGILIAGKPSCGKTTLLRDISRQLSYKMKVCVVDERGELGSVYSGVSQNDLGLCDILTGYPKGLGIIQAVRCLSPDIIVCDEIGSQEETSAIIQGLNAGVGIIASVHCSTMEELRHRVQINQLLSTKAFNKVVLMDGGDTPGNINGIYKIGDYLA